MKFLNGSKKFMAGAAVLGAFVLGGCFMTDSGSKSADVGPNANLVVSVGMKDVNNLTKPGLGKASAITFKHMIITLTSSIATDEVIRDTLVADPDSAFKPDAHTGQSVLKNYSVKPLRDWTVSVETFDVNDSVIHGDSVTQTNLQIGETRAFLLNLAPKFVVYVAKFVLPDSIGSADVNVTAKQKLNIKRFVMIVEGDTVRDTTSTPGYFAADPVSHEVIWDYVSTAVDSPRVELYVFTDSLGGMGSWDPDLPLFADTIVVTNIDSTYTPELPYTGPGSPSDPNYDPANPGGAVAGLEIVIGPVGIVEINPVVPTNPLPRRKD